MVTPSDPAREMRPAGWSVRPDAIQAREALRAEGQGTADQPSPMRRKNPEDSMLGGIRSSRRSFRFTSMASDR